MNGKFLLDKMDLIAPEFIEAADKAKKKKPIKWRYWAALAACLAVSVVSGVIMAVSPDEGAGAVAVSQDAASLFSEGGVLLILFVASIVAALAIAALLIKEKDEK